jgi:hypothetical protein
MLALGGFEPRWKAVEADIGRVRIPKFEEDLDVTSEP